MTTGAIDTLLNAFCLIWVGVSVFAITSQVILQALKKAMTIRDHM